MTWFNALKPLPDSFASIDGAPAEGNTTTNVAVGIEEDRKHERRASVRTFKQRVQLDNAIKHLGRLPDDGESFHCIMRGTYNGWDLVPALIEMAGGIAVLHVATLGFNEKNGAELCDLIDRGTIGRVWFLCSHYFKGANPEIYGPLADAMKARGQRILAMRSHAKVMLFALPDGRRFVVESSANLRSCKNIEQFCMTHDAGLYEFHREWIEEMFTKHER